MWRAWVRAGSLALALLAVAPWARAECTKDLDCAGEQICEAGQCAEPAPTGAAPAAVTPPATESVKPARVLGPARVLTLESVPVAESPGSRMRSPALLVVGSVAATAGVYGLLAGLLSMETTCHRELADDFKVEHCERSANYLAFALGGVALLGGGAMILVGTRRVPAEPQARVTPWLSPKAGGLTLRLEL